MIYDFIVYRFRARWREFFCRCYFSAVRIRHHHNEILSLTQFFFGFGHDVKEPIKDYPEKGIEIVSK